MKINKISLLDSKGTSLVSYELSNSINIFYGFSGNGKTLLFNLICYALASSTEIDIVEAQRNFDDLTFIELTLDENFIIKRKVTNNEFEGSVCGNIINDKTEYRDLIESKMGFKKIKLVKNKSYETITYRLVQFIDFLFFSEDKIGSQDPLCKCGKNEKGTEKYNLLKYLVTGNTILPDSVEILKKELKEEKKESNALKTIKHNIVMPPKNYQTKRLKILKALEDNNKLKNKLLSEQECLTKDIVENKLTLIRLNALMQFNKTKIDDIELAQSFNNTFNDTELLCQHCGEKISLINPYDYNEEKSKLIEQTNDIKKNIDQINTKIISLRAKKKDNADTYGKYEKEIKKLKQDLFELDQNFYNYSLYLQIEKIFTKSEKMETKEKVDLQENEINTKFSTEIDNICDKITERLKKWGLKNYCIAKFDFGSYDFTFSGTKRKILAKGYKSLCTCAFIIELMLRFKEKNINYLNFVLLDSLWTASDLRDIAPDKLSDNIINDFKNIDLQILIFENNPYNFISTNNNQIKSFNLNSKNNILLPLA